VPTTLAITNQKGGVGKTTTAISVSAALAQQGQRVLLVDLDPQANATSGLGLRDATVPTSVYEMLMEDGDVNEAMLDTDVDGLRLLPSTIDLAGAEVELVSAFTREQRLRSKLAHVPDDVDIILIDCPPSLGLLTINAMVAADAVIVPIQCEYYALEGLEALRRNIELVRSHLNPSLEILGFVLTMLDARTRLSQQVVDEVRLHFGDKVFEASVPRSVRLAEAPGFGQPITAFDPTSRGAVAYQALAREMLGRLPVTDPQ